MNDFADCVALVTGASRGIGRATALAFAREGAHVIVNFRKDAAGAQDTVAQIVQAGGQATALQADVSQVAELGRMVDHVEGDIGPIAVLVNNAGAVDRTPFLDVTLEQLDAVLDTNIRGVYYLSQLVARKMAVRRKGAIIHVTSILAQQTIPGRTAYAASKGALESLTRAMALDLAPYQIRVNAVAPGLIRTEMLLSGLPGEAFIQDLQRFIPFKRFGEPEELARAIVFLASPAASYISGALIPVDAGLRVMEAGPR
jgi:NAD(P)-dependent dehydrogenase (short-subunit alcohol dehydrogenase family)